ncbi:MAG: hypothetical protein BMS9Abin37_0570 [Acidobacteriota bacterium]|nr:MAG: hypothetical protein BMS9Abin37_0570 [Acidobacteriota bacterium]
MNFLNVVASEILMTFKRPRRALHLFDRKRRRSHFHYLQLNSKIGDSWSRQDASSGFETRNYVSYEDYLEHQKDKRERIDLSQYDVDYRETLGARLKNLKIRFDGMTVLCLAARIGTEVKSFLDLGCFAVGIDLNPGTMNCYVLYGDFHELQFPSGSVDIVFTNSLDHVYDLEKVLVEARRVLKDEGFLIVEAAAGSERGVEAGFYESFWWKNVDELIQRLNGFHFETLNRSSFDSPWPGEQIFFRKSG